MRDRECIDKLLQRADELSDDELVAINAMAMMLYRKQQLGRTERDLSRTLAARLGIIKPSEIEGMWTSTGNPVAVAEKKQAQAKAESSATPDVLKRLPMKPPSASGMVYRNRGDA